MINIFHTSLLMIALFCLSSIMIKELIETKNTIKKIRNQKKNFEIKYEKLLVETKDTKLIFNYFLETKKKLSDDLHNIMLGLALGDDYFAKLYLKELKLDRDKIEKRIEKKTGCRCSERRWVSK